MKRWAIAVIVAALIGVGGLAGCVATRLPNVALTPSGPPAEPPILGRYGDDLAVASAQDWTERRSAILRDAFQASVYGRFPDPAPVTVGAKTVVAEAYRDGKARLEQWDVALGGQADGMGFSMLIVAPRGSTRPTPMIVMQNFCGNAAVFPDVAGIAPPRGGAPGECGNALMRPVVKAIFGDAIMTPPLDQILASGWGLAMVYAGEVVPDDKAMADAALAKLTPQGAPPAERAGAIAAWAWTYVRTLEALQTDDRFDASRIVLWGHSRNGKAALLAAAMDPRPAAVIALQAGTAGGSLGRDTVGESIAQLTKTYPHWLSPAYAAYAPRQDALPVDQHQLIGLIAPRPVLLQGARRDQWSDPIGAYRALEGAAPAYALFGAPPFAQPDIRTPSAAHPLAMSMRPGLHGVHTIDWAVALDFLRSRLPGPAAPAAVATP